MLYGIRRGFIIGLSGALGDVIYALAAAFGVKLIFDLVASYQQWMRLLGGIMLIGAGIFTFRFQPKTNLSVKKSMKETGVFASTFLLALTNPLTLFGYAAAFSAVGVNKIIADRISIHAADRRCLLWFFFLLVLFAGMVFAYLQRKSNFARSLRDKQSGGLVINTLLELSASSTL